MLFRLISSASSPDSSWVGVAGFHSREGNSWCVLIICLVNSFHCFSIFPNDTCAVIILEWCVGYAFNTSWNNTDSLFSCVALMSVIMHAMLERRWVQVIYRWLCTGARFIHLQSVSVIVGRFVGWLMYFPALPNCMSIFHSSTGGTSTTSLMFHDLLFSVAWFFIWR